MSTERFYIENLWRDLAGFGELNNDPVPDINPTNSTKGLRKMNWSDKFESLVRLHFTKKQNKDIDWFMYHAQNRMMMGAFRYGIIGTKKSQGYNHLSSVSRRYKEFLITRNVEELMDLYNLFMLQWHDTNKSDINMVNEAINIVLLFLNEKDNMIFYSKDDCLYHSDRL